jgi:hypothetical protein
MCHLVSLKVFSYFSGPSIQRSDARFYSSSASLKTEDALNILAECGRAE